MRSRVSLTVNGELCELEIGSHPGQFDPKKGRTTPVQQAFIDNTAFRCGFCTPGITMGAKALLNENPSPTEEDLKQGLAGNYCRCGSHYLVIKAVMEKAEKRGLV